MFLIQHFYCSTLAKTDTMVKMYSCERKTGIPREILWIRFRCEALGSNLDCRGGRRGF